MDPTVEMLNYLVQNGEKVTVSVIAIMLMITIFLIMRSFRQSEKEGALSEVRYMEERKSYMLMIKDQMSYQQANVTALQEVATAIHLMNSQLTGLSKTTADIVAVMVKAETSNIIAYIQSVLDKSLAIRLGVLIVAPDGKLSFVNSEAVQLLGVTKEAVYSSNIMDIMRGVVDINRKPFDQQNFPILRAMTLKETVFNKVVGYHHPLKNTLVWFTLNAAPSIQDDGTVISAVCTFFDVGDLVHISDATPVPITRGHND